MYPKLRTYKYFKSDFSYEPYLNIEIAKYRIDLCRLRTSSHQLEIETGRYTTPKLPADRRVCKQCTENVTEDEIHFLISCNKHENLRNKLFSVACTSIPHFHNLNETDKATKLLSSENDQVIFALAKFTHLAFKQCM